MSFSYNEESAPALYDTSTSTAESSATPPRNRLFPRSHPQRPSAYSNPFSLVNAAAGGGGGRKHPYQQYHANSEASWTSAPVVRSSKNPYSSFESSSTMPEDEQVLPQHAQSEPGFEQERFSAYVNRFAKLDPRMDHRASEEKKEEPAAAETPRAVVAMPSDHHNIPLSEQQEDEEPFRLIDASTRQTTRLVAAARRRRHSSRSPPPRGRSPSPVTNKWPADFLDEPTRPTRSRTRQSAEGFPSSNQRSPSPIPPRPRSNSRTRNLAERFENQNHVFAAPPSPAAWNHQHYKEHAEAAAAAADDPNYQDRVEIVTPSPARVKDLKQKLWDPNESLQVAVKPSVRSGEHRQGMVVSPGQSSRRVARYFQPTMQEEPVGTTPQVPTTSPPPLVMPPEPTTPTQQRRMVQSISPKSSRSESSSNPQPRFKSKFYEAAQRGMQPSPARKVNLEPAVANAPAETTTTTTAIPQAVDPPVEPAAVDMTPILAALEENSSPTPLNPQTVASLVARISAVQRDDPNAALAQIDAILQRAESQSLDDPPSQRSSSGNPSCRAVVTEEKTLSQQQQKQQQQSTVKDPKKHDNEDEDDSSSCDETSVSSITNPTYQSKQVGLAHHHNSSSKHRSLKVYTALGGIEDEQSRRRRRKNRIGSPPPSTIRLGGKKSMPQVDEDEEETPPAVDDLAEKIKRWDEISTPGKPPRPEATETTTASPQHPFENPMSVRHLSQKPPVPSSSSRSRRPHPWDSSLPVRMGQVDTRDTSMDSALGVETQFIPKYPVGTELPSPARSHESISPARQLRKERLAREKNKELLKRSQSASEDDDDNAVDRKDANGNCRFAGDAFDVDPQLLETQDNTGWEVTPRITPLQQENTRALSEDFDSAWVSLPTSSFFQDRWSNQEDADESRVVLNMSEPEVVSETKSYRRQPDPAETPAALRPSRKQQKQQQDPPNAAERSFPSSPVPTLTIRDTHITVETPTRRPVQTFTPKEEEVNAASANHSRYTTPTRPSTEAPSTPLAYDQGVIGKTKSTDSSEKGVEVALVRPSANSTPRRGLRGLLKKRRSTSRRDTAVVIDQTAAPPNGHDQPLLLNAMNLETAELPPPSRGRRGRRQASPSHSRERAHSLEERRIRNPNIAKKFSRLLRVYD